MFMLGLPILQKFRYFYNKISSKIMQYIIKFLKKNVSNLFTKIYIFLLQFSLKLMHFLLN